MANTTTITNLLQATMQISRANKYRVMLDVGDSRTLNIMCTEASMNGLISTPVDVWYRGRKAQMRGESSFNQTWSITFYNNVDLSYRHKFIEWMRRIHHSKVQETGTLEAAVPAGALGALKNAYGNISNAVNELSDTVNSGGLNVLNMLAGTATPSYQGEVKIFQLNDNGEEAYHQTLTGLFPVEVSNIDYSDSSTELTTTTVTFAFTDCTYAGEDKAGGIAEGLFGSAIGGMF